MNAVNRDIQSLHKEITDMLYIGMPVLVRPFCCREWLSGAITSIKRYKLPVLYATMSVQDRVLAAWNVTVHCPPSSTDQGSYTVSDTPLQRIVPKENPDKYPFYQFAMAYEAADKAIMRDNASRPVGTPAMLSDLARHEKMLRPQGDWDVEFTAAATPRATCAGFKASVADQSAKPVILPVPEPLSAMEQAKLADLRAHADLQDAKSEVLRAIVPVVQQATPLLVALFADYFSALPKDVKTHVEEKLKQI